MSGSVARSAVKEIDHERTGKPYTCQYLEQFVAAADCEWDVSMLAGDEEAINTHTGFSRSLILY